MHVSLARSMKRFNADAEVAQMEGRRSDVERIIAVQLGESSYAPLLPYALFTGSGAGALLALFFAASPAAPGRLAVVLLCWVLSVGAVYGSLSLHYAHVPGFVGDMAAYNLRSLAEPGSQRSGPPGFWTEHCIARGHCES